MGANCDYESCFFIYGNGLLSKNHGARSVETVCRHRRTYRSGQFASDQTPNQPMGRGICHDDRVARISAFESGSGICYRRKTCIGFHKESRSPDLSPQRHLCGGYFVLSGEAMETLELDVSRLPAIGLSRVFCELSRILSGPFQTLTSVGSISYSAWQGFTPVGDFGIE